MKHLEFHHSNGGLAFSSSATSQLTVPTCGSVSLLLLTGPRFLKEDIITSKPRPISDGLGANHPSTRAIKTHGGINGLIVDI